MNYLIFTYATNLVSSYFVWRLWVCYFINGFPGIHRNDYKKLTLESLPIVLLTLAVPVPFVGLIVTAVQLWNENGLYFRYHKPKYVLKISKDIGKQFLIHSDVDVGYVPKYIHPTNQNTYLYTFDLIEPHTYHPTPRMIKARSGKFTKTER